MKRILAGVMLAVLAPAFTPNLIEGGESAKSASISGVEAIVNGGFESGLKPWVSVANVAVVAADAHSGLKSLQLSSDGRVSVTYQLVNVPAFRPVLEFWLRMGPTCEPLDRFEVSLETSSGAHVATLTSIPGDSRYRDWQPIAVDMAPYAGRKGLRLKFAARVNAFSSGRFGIDDVLLLGNVVAPAGAIPFQM